MATVKELLTNLGDNTRKFLGTSDTLSLEEMTVGIGKASDESDFQTELIEEFSNILDRSAAPDSYANGKEDGYADALDKRTDLVVTENGDYTPPNDSTGFKSVSVQVQGKLAQVADGTLTEITENDLAGVTKVIGYAFYGQTALVSVSGKHVLTVGEHSFRGCSALESVSLPSLTKVPSYAFHNCSSLRTVNLPNITRVSGYAFQSCSSLESVHFENLTDCADSESFGRCTSLKMFDAPNLIKLGGFYQCAFQSLSFPKVTTVRNQAIVECTKLETINLPSATSIESNALVNCKVLRELRLGATPPKLGSYLFSGCPALKRIVVPIGCKAAYDSATNWATYADIIVEGDL